MGANSVDWENVPSGKMYTSIPVGGNFPLLWGISIVREAVSPRLTVLLLEGSLRFIESGDETLEKPFG